MKKITLRLRPALFPLFPIFPLLLLLLFPGCKPCDDPTDPECPNYCVDETNPECPNYDPCWDQTEVSAEFHMYERGQIAMPDDWVDYDTDTLCGWGVEFNALEENAEYEWYLGTEVIRSQRFVRTGFPEGVPLTVTLIVRKSPNSACFPKDDGIDTLTRTFVSYEGIINCFEGRITTPIQGRYEGTFASEPGVLQQIEVMPCGMYIIPGSQPDTVLRPGVTGLLPTDTCGQWSINARGPAFFGYRQWYFWADNRYSEEDRQCFKGYHIRLFQPFQTDSLYINYKAAIVGGDSLLSYQFRGKKTN